MALGVVIGIKDEPQIPLRILCDVEITNGLSRLYEAVHEFHLSGSDHLWLQYHIPKFDELKGDNVLVKFHISDSTGLAFLKSCGVHLVRRYGERATDQMLNPQVQGVPLEDADVHLDAPDEARRARAGISWASSAPVASEAEPIMILSDEEGGDAARVSLQGAVWRMPAKTSQAGPSRQDEAGGSSFFELNKISNWFSHQKHTSNTDICEIDITQTSCSDGEITGMALGAIIGLKDQSQISLPIICTVQIINGYSRHFEAKTFHLSGSNHLWLRYHIPKFDDLKGDNVRVKFQIRDSTGLAFFKSCGVHLVRWYEEKAIDQMLNAPNEAVENSVDLMNSIQLTNRRREGHNYDDHLENSCCPPQKRHCGAVGMGISGTDNIQEHQSTSLNPKGKMLTKDKVRVKGPRLRSSFHGCLGVGVGIGLRFKMYRPRRRKIQEVISNSDDHSKNKYCPRRKRHCGALGIRLSGTDNIQEHQSTSLNPRLISKGKNLDQRQRSGKSSSTCLELPWLSRG